MMVNEIITTSETHYLCTGKDDNMSELKYYVKGFDQPFGTDKKNKRTSVDIKDKPKIYFTCHPKDLDRYFEKVRGDLFQAGDCVIFCTEDMTEPLDDENRELDLERMNLFVIPVTFRLLTEPNRAMDEDFAFAEEHHIPVLPLMMESNIDSFYQEKFGTRQYLEPYSTDLTAVSYEDKLKKYFKSVFLDEETIKRIRGMFDAYIFLSYRKKDRRYANELMRLIHRDPQLEKLAIWYDEFLTPTESFEKNIRRIMQDSKLMTLLVTPNLLEKPGGKPNFVMEKEYPAARDTGKPILPAEMVKTDVKRLKHAYKGLPDTININDKTLFEKVYLETLRHYAVSKNRNDPEHNYLVGLAYLDGVDVEVDKEKGVRMITSAAEAKLPEAICRLYWMYSDGIDVKLDYKQALKWAKRYYDYCVKAFGDSEYTFTALSELSFAYGKTGDYLKSLQLNENCYQKRKRTLGEKHPHTLISLNNLAKSYSETGNHQEALRYGELAYRYRQEVLGEKHPDTLQSMNNLASEYGECGDLNKQLHMLQQCFQIYNDTLGEKHPDTLHALNNLAVSYSDTGHHKEALRFSELAYRYRQEVLGDNHPDTLKSMNNLASEYGECGDLNKQLQMLQRCYRTYNDTLGEKHPDTLRALNNLAVAYSEAGKHKEALRYSELAYRYRREVLGEKHPVTLRSMHNLASEYGECGDLNKQLQTLQRCYETQKKHLGDKHPDTLQSLSTLAETYYSMGNYQQAEKCYSICYQARSQVLGADHPDTIDSLLGVGTMNFHLKNYRRAIPYLQRCYQIQKEKYGEFVEDTLITLSVLQNAHAHYGADKSALDICRYVYNNPDVRYPQLLKNTVIYFKNNNQDDMAKEISRRLRSVRIKNFFHKHT